MSSLKLFLSGTVVTPTQINIENWCQRSGVVVFAKLILKSYFKPLKLISNINVEKLELEDKKKP